MYEVAINFDNEDGNGVKLYLIENKDDKTYGFNTEFYQLATEKVLYVFKETQPKAAINSISFRVTANSILK